MIKKEYRLLESFIKKPWKKFKYKEIKNYSKNKSVSYVFTLLKKFAKEGVLNEEKAGNVILYSLNFDSLIGLAYIGFISEYTSFTKKHLSIKNLKKIMKKIPTSFFIFLVTGSYANNTFTKKSDIDVVIICDDSVEIDKVYSELRYESEMSIPKIHLYIFKEIEFFKMLLDNKQNYGKEISKNNLILYGGKEYLKILGKAIKNGFTGWNIFGKSR